MAISDNWTPSNIAWAAGLFEGEGCINPRCNALSITMTDFDVLQRFLSIAGVGKIVPRAISGKLGNKPQWTWRVNKQEYTQALLAAFWPWLGERRKNRAEDFMRHMATAYKRRLHFGEKNGNSKLTFSDVVEIRSRNETHTELSKRFGVTLTNIGQIKANKIWRCVNVN